MKHPVSHNDSISSLNIPALPGVPALLSGNYNAQLQGAFFIAIDEFALKKESPRAIRQGKNVIYVQLKILYCDRG